MDRFKDVTCTGLLNWGNVHVCVAHKHLDEAAANGTPLAGVRDKVRASCQQPPFSACVCVIIVKHHGTEA